VYEPLKGLAFTLDYWRLNIAARKPAAAEQAESALARIKAPTDPRAEPWPPMRAVGGAGSGL
jgi:hypothetical protein